MGRCFTYTYFNYNVSF